jgi:serine phosphatase RsbU (regulator of sigma subunit)
VSEQNSLRARGFSIGTKLILITVLIETLTVVAGLALSYAFLSETRFNQYKQLLFTQSDLIAKEVELEKNNPVAITELLKTLDLGHGGAYQLVDNDGLVIWDSRDPKRAGTQVMSQHILYSIAKKSALKRGTADYTILQTRERFLGAYRKVSEHYYILGAISKDQIEFEIERTLERFFDLALLMYGLSFIVIVFFTRQIITPVQSLTSAALKIAAGDFNIQLEKPSRDEIGLLSETFALMTQQIRTLLQGEEQKIRIEQEVGSVAELQQILLPPPLIQHAKYEISSFYQSATETGGDYWGYFDTEDHLIIYAGDATGHGLPSAMLTAAARGCFSALQSLYREAKETPSLESFLTYANQAVLNVSQGQLQMTLFVAMISFNDHTLSFANAAHQSGLLLRAGAQPTLEILLNRGMRLGENVNFKCDPAKTVPFRANDILFLYSDGLTDLTNGQGEALGKNALKECLRGGMQKHQSIVQMRESVKKLAKDFQPDELPEDDITFAFLRLKS